MKKKEFSINRFFIKPRKKALTVALVVLIVNLVFGRQISHHYATIFLDEKRQSIKGELELYGDSLTITLNSYFALLEGVHGFVQAENNSPVNHVESTFNDLAAVFHEGALGVRNFSIAPNGVQTYVYPRKGNEIVLGHDLLNDERPAVRADVAEAIETREIALSGPYELRQGGLGFVARQAVYVDDEFWGLVAMVVDIPPLLASAGLSNDNEHLIFALEDENGEVFFGDDKILDEEPIHYEVLLPDGSWTLSAVPRDGWNIASLELLLIQSGVIFVSVSLALITYLFVNRNKRLQHNVEEKTQALNEVVLELEESEKKYRVLYDNSPDMYASVSPEEAKILMCNKTLLSETGYSKEEVIGSPIFMMYHDDSLEKAKETFQQFATTGKVRDRQLILKRKDGSKVDVILNVDAIRDGTGKILYSISSWRDVTERKQIEQKLQQSEERFRSLFDDSADAYLILDENIFVNCNQATLEMLRASSKAEVLSTHPSQLSPEFQPDGQPSVEKAEEMIRIALEQGSNRFEWLHRRMDGEDFPVEVLLTPIVVGDKTIIHTVWRDITERKETENELKASHARLLTLLDSIPADIYVSDLKSHKIIFVNNHMRDSFGDDQVGKVCYEVFRNETEQCSICPYEHLLDENGNPTEKFVWEGQNPISKKWFVNYDRAIPWTDGRLVHVQIAFDITDRKKTEEALQENEQRLRRYLEQKYLGMAITSSEKYWLQANDALCEMFGYSFDELSKLTWADVSHPDDLDANLVLFNRAQAGEIDSYSIEKRFIRKDESIFYAELSANAIRKEDGSVDYMVTIINDVTERKGAEEALQKLNDELDERVEKRTKELNDMLSLMSGREIRMAELKKVITALRTQLKEAGIAPTAFDPLLGSDKEW